MSDRGIDPGLRRSVERGDYRIDSQAVAKAVIRSWMLVAAQPRDGAGRPEKEQSASG
jgi:hypothetical protein